MYRVSCLTRQGTSPEVCLPRYMQCFLLSFGHVRSLNRWSCFIWGENKGKLARLTTTLLKYLYVDLPVRSAHCVPTILISMK